MVQAHIKALETGEQDRQALILGLEYLLQISYVNEDEVLKICLDYWQHFVLEVFDSVSPTPASSPGAPRVAPTPVQGSFLFGGVNHGGSAAGKRGLYGGVLSRLRGVMIARMAKPEEVTPPSVPMHCSSHLLWSPELKHHAN